MFKESLENSKTAHLIKKYLKGYDSAESVVTNAYKSSLFLKLKLALQRNHKKYGKADFLTRSTEENTEILAGSKIIEIVKNLSRKHASRRGFLPYLKENIDKLYLGPFKQISVIMLVAVSANIFFLLILGREITFYGWILRFSSLLVSLCGLSCTVSLKTILESSIFSNLVSKSTNEKR